MNSLSLSWQNYSDVLLYYDLILWTVIFDEHEAGSAFWVVSVDDDELVRLFS